MSHSYDKIWTHAIWATKEREVLINFDIEKQVYQYIKNKKNTIRIQYSTKNIKNFLNFME